VFPLCKIQKCVPLSNANTKDQTFHRDKVLRPQITVVLATVVMNLAKHDRNSYVSANIPAHRPRLENGFVT
jgi:hypothetical protein